MARDAGNRWIFPELTDEDLEPWGGVRFVAVAGADRPTRGVDVTGELIWVPDTAVPPSVSRRRSSSTSTSSPSRGHRPWEQ
ncbi:hypothetical protein [Streptomyces sp. NPDC005303]|uniref:hypothetical protein n=1 Tax=Streptomyces sp. NPDC005303 TaxID=3155713 RepID=UPI0033B6F451